MAFSGFFRFEPPSIRQARLRDTTTRLTGEVLSFNEQLEENRSRLREVEARLQPPPRPTTGTFATGEITTPEQRLALSAPPTPEEVETALQRGGPSIIDAPRQLVKREVIEPLVPEFRAELPARPTSLLPPGIRETVELGAQATGVDLPETTVITSGLVEEAASFVLDPLNLVFFAGPILKGAGGAARVAAGIRRAGQVPEFVRTAMQAARRASVEEGGGTLRGLAEAKDFFGRLIDPLLPQGGISGGFRPRPRGMQPGARVTGLTQEGERIEGTLIQALGERAIVRDAAGNVRPVTTLELVEAAEKVGIGTRLRDIGRDFRFGPSSRTAVPSLDPSVQKFVRVFRTAKPAQATLGAERAEELGRRAARGRIPFEAEARTPEEALRGLRGAQRGRLPEAPEFEVTLPSGARGAVTDAFTQEEVTNFINIARFSPALDRELFTRGNIIESLIGSA